MIYDTSYLVMNKRAETMVRVTKNNSYIAFKNIDLTGISKLKVNTGTNDLVGTLEIWLGSENGQMISSRLLDLSKKSGDFDFPMEPVKGFQKLYFVYKTNRDKTGIWIAFDIVSIIFIK